MPVYRQHTRMGLVKMEDINDFIKDNDLPAVFGGFNPSLINPTQIEYCYDLLYDRYAYSTLRYTDQGAALVAIRRIAKFAFPELIAKENLYKDVYGKSIDELKKQRQNIRNLIEKPNETLTNPDKTPFTGLSSQQETITNITNDIEETLNKWNALKKDMYNEFYNRFSSLFVAIAVDSDDITIYPQEDLL